MKISFYDKVQIACHIERKISSMGISNLNIIKDIYKDIEKKIKQEFGLDKKNSYVKKRQLYAVHELVDCYEIPAYLQRLMAEED
jgi:hypothetical protein